MDARAEFEWTDYLIIALYFLIVLLVGLWATFRPDRGTSAGYFLASNGMTWIPIGASLYASNIGAHMFVGLPASGAKSGLAVTVYEWHAIYLLILLGWIFVPVYFACGAFTVPQYARRRHDSKRLEVTLATISFVVYILNRVSSQMYASVLFLRFTLGWNAYISITAILIIATINTIAGGLAAVIYTDTLQAGVFITGAGILFVKGIGEVGGWQNMERKYSLAYANYTFANQTKYACGLPRRDAFHLLQAAGSDDIPWTGAVSGLTFMGMFYWCFDQVGVQRCLSAKNMTHAKAGAVLAGFLKLAGVLLFVVPGIISRCMFPETIACADPIHCAQICDNVDGCWNLAYPLLMVKVLPTGGLQGMMLAAILSALMSTLTSVFNSTSAMFSIDIWLVLRPRATEKEVMITSRTCVFLLMVLSILCLPMQEHSPGGQLWEMVQSVSAYCYTPVSVVMLASFLWNRVTEAGAFWGLVCGILIGCTRFVLDRVYPVPPCGSSEPDNRPMLIAQIHFLHFAAILSVITFVIVTVISLQTKAPTQEKLSRVTWWNRRSKQLPYWLETNEERERRTTVGSNDSTEDTPRRLKNICGQFFCTWICEMESGDGGEQPVSTMTNIRTDISSDISSTAENCYWSRVVDIAAILLATVTTFLFGLFA